MTTPTATTPAMNGRSLFLLLASTMTVMAGATLAPALPGMEAAFAQEENAEFWVKMILSAPGLLIACCAPMVGWLLDHWKKKQVLILALCLYGVSGVSGYFLHDSLIAILLGRIALGVAVAGVMVACTTLAGDYFAGPNLARYMGLQAAFGGFGGVLFLGMAGLLADIDWTAPFLIYLFAFIVLPGAMVFLDEPERKQHSAGDLGGAAPAPPGGPLALCYILAAFEVLALYMAPLHYPFYVAQFGVTDGSEIGFAIAGMLLLTATVSMYYRKFGSLFPFPVLHGAGWLLIAIGWGLLGFAPSYGVALAGMAVAGVGFGMIRPNLIVWLFSYTPPMLRGRIIGGVTTCFFIGQFLCPLLTQPLIDHYGISATFAVAGGISLALAALLLAASMKAAPAPTTAKS
ncbi:Permease of the major facilitator superfamily [Hahella chejuensis KCTC 2396]|uniref:Permease of the major facilitator superfamily n=1 Tax=Hahella chejuensis (strain KCTC 2396) TaxID=349521 RepID=Q2S817_HAHCH|nr:MFS transporter [Hahella chejuensis]ABC33207.1 Permease of the major facilitator superfamily [Hahella chejuensis KCTC 2396]